MTKIIKETAKSSAKATKETVKAVIKTIKLMIIAFKKPIIFANSWWLDFCCYNYRCLYDWIFNEFSIWNIFLK